MFRSRKSSIATQKDVASSLSSGNASIVKRSSIIKPPMFSEDINEDEIIDLQATNTSKQDITIESMSAVIAAAVQMSSSGGAPSSLSIGNASILPPAENTNTTKRRFSVRLFSNPWKNNNKEISPTTPTTPSLEPSSPFDSSIIEEDTCDSPRTSEKFDDGRDELIYRGIQIKEIKSTLKPLVITDEERFPMPQIKLERPGFARINY